MSLDATIWAWKQQEIKPLEKLVLLSLADRADELNTCYPSIKRLCLDTGMAKSSVIKCLQSLEESSLLLKLSVKRINNGFSNNVYQLVGVNNREGLIQQEYEAVPEGCKLVLLNGSKRPVMVSTPSTPHGQGASTPDGQALVRHAVTNLTKQPCKEITSQTSNSKESNASRGTLPDGNAPKNEKSPHKEKKESTRRLYQHQVDADEYPYVSEILERLNNTIAEHERKGYGHKFAMDKRRHELTVNPDHLNDMESNLSELGCYADDGEEYDYVFNKLIKLYNARVAKSKTAKVNLAFLTGINMPWFEDGMGSEEYVKWVNEFVLVED